MNPDDQLNSIIDTFEERMRVLFDVSADQVFEYRMTGEHVGTALYVSAQVTDMAPATPCAEDATVDVVLGFHIPRHETLPDRTYRIQQQSALRDRLIFAPGHPDRIPDAGLIQTTSMGVTFGDDPDRGYLMGGITVRFTTRLRKTPVSE